VWRSFGGFGGGWCRYGVAPAVGSQLARPGAAESSPLHAAAAACDAAAATALLADDSTMPDQPLADGTTPLITAALAGCVAVAELLVAEARAHRASSENEHARTRIPHRPELSERE
jgi:ankyrin repeat protein